jgi:hypothetical protein
MFRVAQEVFLRRERRSRWIKSLRAAKVISIHDGSGKLSGARRPLYGADAVARFFIGITKNTSQAARCVRLPSTASPDLPNAQGFSTTLASRQRRKGPPLAFRAFGPSIGLFLDNLPPKEFHCI